MPMPPIPLPGDKYDDRTVIASVYIVDDPPQPTVVMLLLLNPRTPYYAVVDVQWDGEKWVIISEKEGGFENIVPAVEHYTEYGGDY